MDCDGFLLLIYQAARVHAQSEFQRAVASLLRSRFPFGAMMWGNGRLNPSRSAVVPTALYVEGLDDDFLRQWAEQVAGRDPAIALLAQAPGCAIPIEVAHFYHAFPGLVAFGREFGIESFTLISGPGLEQGQTSWLCLYRQGTVAQPTDVKLSWLEACMPHIAEAWRINVAIHKASRRSIPCGFALAEARTGQLLSSDDDFRIYLIDEWSDFDGQFVPSLLAHSWLQRDEIIFEGRQVCFHAKRVADLVYLSASPASGMCHGLTPRLRQVAGMYVKGLSHKEIARRIGVSPSTVRNQIAAAYAQLRIHTRTQLLELLEGENEGEGDG